MSTSPSQLDRIVGCLIGGAIGDAAGSRYEGQQPPISVRFDEHWFVTDDTQLTLATCTGILRPGEVSADSIATEFARAFQARTLVGLGASTYQALELLAAGGHWALVGRKGDQAAGNGPAMRAAPLAFLLDLDVPGDRQLFRDVCRITHHNDEAYVGALAIAFAVRAAWREEWNGGPGLASLVARQLPDSGVRDRLRELSALDPATPLRDVALQYGNSAWSVESVPLAVLAVQQLRDVSFTDWLEAVIEIGGDTDTIASMAGQIAGCWLGFQRIPMDLVARVPDSDALRNKMSAFARRVLRID